jgi:ABC-type Fe3+/spermidine/putrescine transport system ATPase subunit
VAEFIGLSNFLEGKVQAVRGPEMVVTANGLQVSTPALSGVGQGQKVLLFLRPNEIEILPPQTPPETNLFEARVEKATYLGDTMDYRLRLGQDAELRVQSDARHRYQNGDSVRLRLRRVRSWTVTD